jgi:hypothetical protein
MKPEDWCFASGAAVGREASFLPHRTIEEMASLAPPEAANRLARSWFGPAEPLGQFDRFARERRQRELDYFERVSPDGMLVKLLRLGSAADRLREGLSAVQDGCSAEQLADALRELAVRSGAFCDDFLREFSPPLPDPAPSARLASALLIDSAELAIGARLASGEESLRAWSQARSRAFLAKVSLRAVRQNAPKELLRRFFFRGELATTEAHEFLQDYREAAALRLYPQGCEPGLEEGFLLSAIDDSRGQPFSAGVVLRYLLGYLDQERRIRRAVYACLGKIPAGGEARPERQAL